MLGTTVINKRVSVMGIFDFFKHKVEIPKRGLLLKNVS